MRHNSNANRSITSVKGQSGKIQKTASRFWLGHKNLTLLAIDQNILKNWAMCTTSQVKHNLQTQFQ